MQVTAVLCATLGDIIVCLQSKSSRSMNGWDHKPNAAMNLPKLMSSILLYMWSLQESIWDAKDQIASWEIKDVLLDILNHINDKKSGNLCVSFLNLPLVSQSNIIYSLYDDYFCCRLDKDEMYWGQSPWELLVLHNVRCRNRERMFVIPPAWIAGRHQPLVLAAHMSHTCASERRAVSVLD